MKKLLLLSLLAVTMLLMSCGPATEITRNNDGRGLYADEVNVEIPGTTLDQYLKRLNGVKVVGEGRNAVVQIRGVASFELSTEPLFILDGVRLGSTFKNVYDLINISDISTIEVLTSSRATLLYGSDGFSGAIVINLKQS